MDGKTGYPALWVTVDGPRIAEAALAQLDLGTDLVKVYMDAPGGVRDSPFTVEDLKRAVDAVHARGARVAAHSGYLDGARVAAAAGVDSIEHGKESALASLAAARRAGVRIATGSDFGGGSVRAGHLAWEVELLVQAGLEPYEALASATRHGGALLGIDHAGRIAEGLPADLVLVHGDPLSDPRALWRVWAVYQGGTRVA